MIRPTDLQKDDTIGLVAPGRKLDAATLHACTHVIESWGFRVQTSPNLLSSAHSYLAGSDAERLEDLQIMLDSPAIKAIICARGGYGTTRVLDQLDFRALLKKPKWICGFSDITALHLKLQKLGIQSIHGTMPVLFLKSDSTQSVDSLHKVLKGERAALAANPNSKNKMGSAEGNLVGGNLSLVVDSLGTSSEVDTENKILVIEEVDEYLYKIDRMFVQLKRAGKLQKLAGLAIGHMTDLKDTDLPFGETIESIILNHVKEFDYPVGFGFPVGHANPNLSWVEGGLGKLHVTREKSIIMF
jgi:muramoyltetrapeptide carboxypeptidase